ncbi:MAG: PIN domain-containing protein [Methylococcaceae bacterium]|nr:MAG: PIN domain-containing protein [Methylococcaceae bacterium]
MERALVDTSAWFAYVNRNDPDHARIRNVFRTFSGRLITSNFIFDETVTLCLYRMGHKIAMIAGEILLDSSAVDLVRLTQEDERKAWTLFLSRPDKTYSFTDCTSFVLMKRLGLQQAIALDADFQQEGFLFPTN